MAGFGTFFGLNTGISALQTAQQALSVIGNNIANAATPGYTEETANISEATPFPPIPSSAAPIVAGQVGEGSTVTSVDRQVSPYYNTLVRNNQTSYSGQNTLLTNLNEIQGIIGEPTNTSIHAAIDSFFSSWQTLSTQPDSKAARQTVIQQAKNLADTFTTVQNQLVSVVGNLDNNISDANAGQIAQVNQYATQLNDLNKQIVAIKSSGQNPNQLLDQRDTILNNLAKLGNMSTAQNADGSISVSFGTVSLVTASGSGTYSTTAFTNTDTSSLTSGAIWANEQSISTAQNVIEKLGTLQGAIADSVNTQLNAGYQLNSSTPGVNLFSVTTKNVTSASGNTTTPVEQMAVVTGFNTDQLAAAQTPNVAGDGSNATAIAAMQSSTTLTDSTPKTPVSLGATPDGYYTAIVSQIGAQTSAVQSSQKTANSLLQQAQTMQQSVSGVNQNAEMTKMVEFQNMYTAAAKYISVQDQMLQNLIQVV